MDKIRVLFLAADPSNVSTLRISEEARAIDLRIRAADHRDRIELIPALAVRPSDLQEALMRHRPHIVHFTAHGGRSRGILLQDEAGNFVPVSSTVLRALLQILKDDIRVLILEEHYSTRQLRAVVHSIGCVIAIPMNLSDVGRILFCSAFYRALAYGRSIKESFKLAITDLLLEGFEPRSHPKLIVSSRFNRAVKLLGAPSTPTVDTEVVRKQKAFASLDFGAPAAERDISKGLSDYFIESEAFRRVYSGGRFILLGNRGVGKSAIFKIMGDRERRDGTLVIELRPEDFSYGLVNTLLPPGPEDQWVKQGAYTAAWKYLIYVLIMKALTETGPNLKRGPAQRIYSYLRNNHRGFQRNPIAWFLSYLSRMEGIKIGSYEAAIKATKLIEMYKLEEIAHLLPDVAELCKAQKVLVLVDDLDQGWNGSEDAKAFVAGLFQAVISINQLTSDSSLRTLLSLRMELYDNIPSVYDDVQKYRDVMEIISWDETSLLQLVAKRIRHAIPSLEMKKDADCWNAVFAETLHYRKTKSYKYIVDRTLYRPREIIQFCTDALERARERQSWPIDYPVISDAEAKYSKGRTDDIVGEYRFQYPGLDSVFAAFRGESYNYSRTELEGVCRGIADGEYVVSESASWTKEQPPDYLIEVLWKIGFLRAQSGAIVNRIRRSSGSYLGPHQVSNLNLRNVSRFQVHPMFRSFLGMKEDRERQSKARESKV